MSARSCGDYQLTSSCQVLCGLCIAMSNHLCELALLTAQYSCYRVIEKDCHKYFFSDGPKKIKKCNNPMIFKELFLGGFGILMFQKCHVCGILPFEAFPI